MSDKTLTCKDCSVQFIFSEGEQNFYKEKGFMNEPQRCLSCRTAKKQQRRGRNNFSKPNAFGNRMEFRFGSK
ncbi:zinc-ribbon domain-containing protein [Herbivorax sp. ANBcel31]|uniref:zinc-ribbon domain-containing protein n=1 Tax=Herbivorax sp. ANBcel31 TaxID=3069754 RepID=UPI0027ADDCB5|nr:zinc-ribbon domain-containing protein [Herbivorax sp. ANBcel31]MDQ2087126.1 zinc-ribbon domain-containing protein [Herbivorax sp. ANBcel31]